MRRYCLYCKKEGDNIGKYPCQCSPIGSHRVVTEGEKKYRVKSKKDGYIYLFDNIPEGYELIETIVY